MTLKSYFTILIAALSLIAVTGFAEDSGPSNTVGYWKLNVGRGYSQVSFPLLPAVKTLNNVIGNQLTGGTTQTASDQIMRWNAASRQFQVSWYNTTSQSWQGEFSDVREAESYWIYVQPTHPVQQTVTICGNVCEQPVFNMGTLGIGYNSIGSVWAAPTPISQAGLGELDGGVYLFLSDQILSYDAATGTYQYAWRTENGTWQGNLTLLEPAKGYWIYVAPGHPGFHWNNYPQPLPTGGTSPWFAPRLTADQSGASNPLPFMPPTPAMGNSGNNSQPSSTTPSGGDE
jgi:hypothetical protein